jgi:hypothetical protein
MRAPATMRESNEAQRGGFFTIESKRAVPQMFCSGVILEKTARGEELPYLRAYWHIAWQMSTVLELA